MNFTKPQDFQYVQGANIDGAHPYGDLNRIEIDNDIMPVRNTEDKRKLRGIDIAFLMEAVEERARARGLEGETFTFSRNITLSQVNAIIDRWNEIVDEEWEGDSYLWNHVLWMDKEKLEENIEGVVNFYPAYRDSRFKPIKFSHVSDDDILIETVSNLFTEVGKMQLLTNAGIMLIQHFTHTGCNLTFVQHGEFDEQATEEITSFIRGNSIPFIHYGKRFRSNVESRTPTIAYGKVNSISVDSIEYGMNDYFKGFYNNKALFEFIYEDGYGTSHTKIGFADTIKESEKETIDCDALKKLALDYISSTGYQVTQTGYATGIYCEYILPIFELRDRTRWDVEEDAA